MAAPPPPPAPMIGRVLADRYRIVARIGAGGMGVVYRAWDGAGDRYVVVKIPVERAREPEAFLARFAREMEVLRRIDHPHVVPIIDDGTCDGLPFAVMPYLAGGNLSLRRPRRDGAIQPASAALLHRWLPEVAAALDHVHALGFVHRDVKPDNILFDGHGRPMVGDFGLARVSDDLVATDPSLTDTGTVLGTPDYMDPHVLQGGAPVAAGDQYALAVVVYELLAGRRPIIGDTPAARMIAQVTQEPPRLHGARPDLPRSVGDAVHRGLAKKAGARFPSCTAFAAAVLAEIAPPPALQQRRLTCPACQMLIATADRHGGKLGSCPQCKSPVWIAPNLLTLVIPVDREPLPIAAAEPESASPDAPAPPAEPLAPADSLEPAPASEPLSRSRLVAAVQQRLRSRRTMAWSVAIGTVALGLGLPLIMLSPRANERPDIPAGDLIIAQAVLSHTPRAEAENDGDTVDDGKGLMPSATAVAATDVAVINVNVDAAAEQTPETPSDEASSLPTIDPSLLSVPAIGEPLARAPTDRESDQAEGIAKGDQIDRAADEGPAAPLGDGEVELEAGFDPLVNRWRSTIELIVVGRATLDQLEEELNGYRLRAAAFEQNIRVQKAISIKNREHAANARQADGVDAAADHLALALAAEQQIRKIQTEAAPLFEAIAVAQDDVDTAKSEIVKYHRSIAASLVEWIDAARPFDRDPDSHGRMVAFEAVLREATREKPGFMLVEGVVTAALLRVTHGDLASAYDATIAATEAISSAEYALAREGYTIYEYFPLREHRFHVAYAAYRVGASTIDQDWRKKCLDWLRGESDTIRNEGDPTALVLKGLHNVATRQFATAAKDFDAYLRNKAAGKIVGIWRTKGKAAPRGEINDIFLSEIAWFLAAAPKEQRNHDRARELLAQLPRDQHFVQFEHWQALRAEAELLAQDNRWDDALATLARAEQRAPLFMAEEIGVQREAYQQRRPYTLSRKR